MWPLTQCLHKVYPLSHFIYILQTSPVDGTLHKLERETSFLNYLKKKKKTNKETNKNPQ